MSRFADDDKFFHDLPMMTKYMMLSVLGTAMAIVTASCEKKSPAEKAVDDVGDAVEEAADEIGDAVRKAD